MSPVSDSLIAERRTVLGSKRSRSASPFTSTGPIARCSIRVTKTICFVPQVAAPPGAR